MESKPVIRALIIDPSVPSVGEEFISPGLDGLQEAVGGYIEIAFEFDNGDVLYVDEDGLAKAQDAIAGREDAARAWMFDVGAHQPFAGRGVIVGGEGPDGRHTDARTDIGELRGRLSCMMPAAAAAHPGGLPN